MSYIVLTCIFVQDIRIYDCLCVALGSTSPRLLSHSAMSTLAAALAPQSPVAKARGLSPPSAPGRGNKGRNSHGQVLVDVVEVVLVSGSLLAEIARGGAAKLADQFWYTSQLRCQVAALLDVESHRVKLADGEANEISDDECVLDGPLTAIVLPPPEPTMFEGAAPLRM